MKVLFVVSCLSGGGAEFVAAQWARYLAQAADQVAIYTTHPATGDDAPENVTLVRGRGDNLISRTRDLIQFLRAEPADIVVAVGPYWNIMSIAAARIARRRRPKVAISSHGLANRPGITDRRYVRNQWIARRTYRFADLFIAVSHPVGAEAVAEYRLPEDRVVVIPNPALAKAQDLAARCKSGSIDPQHLDIVVPARLVPEKRPAIAVDVAATLAPTFPSGVTVHFFGVGPLHEPIVSAGNAAGVGLVMHGWVDNWFDECPVGSVVLLPSLAEGFGNVLVEAAAAGFKSVVSSRCLGAADAVVPGITGELVTGESAEQYAAAVLTIAHEPVRQIDAWLRRFSFENSGATLRAALSTLVPPVSVERKASRA